MDSPTENNINQQTDVSKKLTSNEVMLRDILIAHLRNFGIDVITDQAAGQRILDDYQNGILNNEIRLQSVFHGSGANFDHFDTRHHLSEGEGNQVFGVGTYVTAVRKVAEQYANIASLTGNKDKFIAVVDGVSFNYNDPKHATDGVFLACDKLAKFGREEAVNALKQNISDYVQLGWSEKEAEAREALNYLNSHDIHVPERGRYLYTVDIPDDNGKNFLYWDGSLTSRQAETIRESLYKAVLERNDDYKGSEKFLAQELSVIKEGSHIGDTYGTISDYLGSDKVASEFLSGLGYTGIKVHTDHFGNDPRYKDDWNYVIFNEKDLGIKDKIKFFKAANGDAFGFTVNNKIYVDPKIANSETPIHEYAHMWAAVLRAGNKQEWANVVNLMKSQTGLWNSVKDRYPQLTTDDEIADEVLATYSGKRGSERLREQVSLIMGESVDAESSNMFKAFEEAIKRFWHDVADLFHIHYDSAEQVADQVMSDMLHGMRSSVTEADGVKLSLTDEEADLDRRYAEAVASGNIKEARQLLVDRAKSKGYLPTDYQGKDSWSAPVAEVDLNDFENKKALQQMVDDFGTEPNIFGIINGIQAHDSDYYYNPDVAGFHGQAAEETAEVLRSLRDQRANGDTQVDIYRVVPNDVVGDQIMQGDWVALSKAYCDELGQHKYGEGNYHVIESRSAIKNLWMGSEDMREFGFDDGYGDVEKNVRNNRKLLDITYDDEGKLIPLSQRFSENNEDIRFQLSDDDNQKYKSNIYEMSEENSPKEKLSSETKRTMETFAEQLVKTMQEMKNSDWKQGWSLGSHGMFGLPMNISGYTYNGINGVITAFDTFKNGYNSPIYLTMKQANAHGWKINEGEHLTRILNYGVSRKYNGKYISQETFDNLPDEEKAKVKKSSHLHVYYEFNLDQTNCHEVNPDLYNKLISLYRGQAPAHDSKGMYVNPELDRMFKKQEWVCPINCDKPSSSAFYRPFTDSITIPLKDQFKISKTEDGIFKDGQEYYSTALHEMAHSTGHESRLNRSLSGEFGSASYAKEELIAEMSSAFVCSALGFDKRINRNSAAYLDSWVKKLSDDPTYIKDLMSPVKKASMMILEGIDKQRLALGMEPLVRNGEVDLVKLAESQSAKQDVNVSSIKEVVVDDKDKNQQVQETSEKESMQEVNKHDTGDTLDKDAIADGYANNLEKQWDEVVKMFGQDENLFDQLTAAASGQPLDSVKHTDKFDIVHDFINQFGGKKELGAETETTTGALYNSHSVAQLKLNDGSILEVNDYSKAFDDSVKDVQELSHVRDGAIIDSARKEIGGVNQNVNQETLNNLWSAFAGSSPMNRSQEQHVVGNQANFDLNKLYNEGIEKSRTDAMRAHNLDNEMHSESDNKQVAASNEEKAVVKPSVDNSEQSYYVEVASYMNSEDVQMFDEIKANESSLLTLARQCDPGDAIDQEYTYKTPYQGKDDKVIAEDDNYAVVFNDEFGSNSYDVMRKVSESDIRLNIDRYGLSQAASDDVIEVAKKYEAEKIAQKVEAGEKQELVENPIMKTFYQIKAEHPNNLLLFQSENGDFINSYEEDARKVSEILRLPLQESDTVKDRNGQFVDTCVFPKHALSTYLPKLVRAGEKVISVDNPIINRDESQDKQKTPHEDSDMRTDVTDTAKQIVASDNVPMEQAEKEAKEIADEEVHKEFHQQQDKLHAEEEKQQQVEKQEQEKKRQEQEQAKKQKVMNPKLYDVFGMKDGQRELVKEGLGIVAAATFVERNSERYQRKGYDYLISMPHVEETLEKSQLKEADMAKEQSPQEQEGKERKNPYQPLFEGTREEAKQIVDALKNDMENPDNTIPYDEILRDATLYGETPLYADKEWYKKYAEGKSDPEIAGLYRRALATLETIPEQQATVKSISVNTVESNQEQEDMNNKEEQLKQQAKKEEELHKEESSMSEPVTPKASSDDSVKEQTEQTKEPFSKEDEKVVNTAAVHAGLLLGALESAKEGIWLNPHGKHGAALLEPGKMITGYNRLMMDLCADKNHYKTNVFTYYDYAKKEEMPVKQGQTSLPIDWTRWDYENVATKEVITTEQYAELTPDKQQDYARHSTKQTRHLYNIDQTAMAGTKVADYSKLVKDNGSKFEDIPELPTDKNFLNLTNRLHGKHKDCTIILGEGDKNFAYGKHAEKVGSVMGVPVQSKDIDGKKVSYIEFPHTALDTVLPKMIGSHNKVALCSNVLESKFEASNNISKNSVRDAATVADKVSRKAGFTLERVLDDVPVSYDKEKDVITYSGNNARQPGRENLAAVEKANDIYRAVVEATGRENRLDRVARFNMLPEDNAKYEKLVQELSAGVLMASHGLPAIISKENRELIPYWEREIKENPKMMAVLEKDVNNSIEQIEKHLLGQEVDYAKVRGARPALFDAKDYTVASKMAQLPNAETKEFVVIRNADKTAADVILPEGAALPGMNKDRITHALAKENIKEVHFYNAGGAQGLYKDNDYFAGKTATLTKLKQWELLPRHVVDISSQYLNVEKKPLIERFRAIPDDSHRWAFNIKAKGEGQFSVYPAKEYLNAYFTARNNPNKVEKAKMMSSLAQRYYAVAQAHPEVKKELIMPKVPEGVDMSKLTGTTIGRDKDDHSKVFVQSTIDGAFHKEPITMAQYQRMWLADDMQDYKNAIAANAFASIIKSAKAQQEADEGLKIVDNSNVKDVVGHSEKQDQGHSESHSDGGSSDSDDKSESEGQGVGDASSKQADKDKSEEENKSRGFHM